jgi:hypothetical protein
VRLHASTNTLNQQNGYVVTSANTIFHFDKNLQATQKLLYFSRRTITVLYYSTSFNHMTTHPPPTSPANTSSHVPRTAADSALTPAHLPVCRAHHHTRVHAPSTHNVSTARVARCALSNQRPTTRPRSAPAAPSHLSAARVHRRSTAWVAAALYGMQTGARLGIQDGHTRPARDHKRSDVPWVRRRPALPIQRRAVRGWQRERYER